MNDLKTVTQMLGKRVPEIERVLEATKQGLKSEDEAFADLLEMSQDPDVVENILSMIQDLDAPLMFDNGVGMLQPNPLLQAALAERLQFDGDIPEARISDLPEGSKPAIPISTRVRNPVAFGRMLSKASDEMETEVRNHQEIRRLGVNSLEWMAEGDPDFDVLLYGSRETDLEGYRRGEEPKPVVVETPSGSALSEMTLDQRKEAAYKFLSTTQGRKSAVAVIRELIGSRIGASFQVEEREYDPSQRTEVLASHEWAVNIFGKGSINDTFNVVDTAALALASALLKQMAGRNPTKVFLEVIPKNSVDVRSVGWSARLVSI